MAEPALMAANALYMDHLAKTDDIVQAVIALFTAALNVAKRVAPVAPKQLRLLKWMWQPCHWLCKRHLRF